MIMTPEQIMEADAKTWARLHPKKTGRKNKHPERDFQESVVALINAQYDCTVVAIDNAKHTKLVKTKTGRMISVEGKGLKKQGKRAGAFDLIIIWWHNQYGWLEVKWDAPVSDEQKDFENEIVYKRGGRCEYIRKKLDHLHGIFSNWGVPKRGMK